jgi:chitodextrinase
LYDSGTTSTSGYGVQFDGVNDVKFYNNTFVNIPGPLFWIAGYSIPGGVLNWDMRNNLFYNGGSNKWDSTSSSALNGIFDYNGWFSAESLISEPNSNIGVDPGFVDLGNKNFRLSSSSQAIDTGSPGLPIGSETDFEGNLVPQDGNGDGISIADLGVYEYTVSVPPSDTIPPSTPTNLQAVTTSTSQINLSWNVSTDNVGVTGYRIYRDGTQVGTTANTTYQDMGLSPSTTYTYTVSAYDAANNESGQSNSVSETTLDGPNIISSRVSQSTDDAEERTDTGVVRLASSDLELIRDDGSSLQIVGMRFQNVQVPKGSTITNAYIEYETDETRSETTNLVFYGEASDNPATFTSDTNNISNRTKTSSSVSWNNVPAWNTINEKHQTPNLSLIIQEIVNRAGWSSGNSIVILVEGSGKRTAESYNGESANAPLLVVGYTTGTNPDTEAPSPPQGFGFSVQ